MPRSFCTLSTLATLGWFLLPCVAHAAEPSVGECLDASDSSLRFNAQRKSRAELAQLLICAAESCPAEIRQECLRRVELVNQSLPSVVFEVRDSAGNVATAVKVTMDNELLAERLDGNSLAVDPGEHQFEFEIAGQRRQDESLVILEAQKNRHELIRFPPASARPTARVNGPPPPPPVAAEHSHRLSRQRIAAIVSGGLGVVGLGVGTAFGLIASSRSRDARDACPTRYCTTQDDLDRWHSAGAAGNVSTVAFIVGSVGMAGAAALWFTDKPASPERTQVGLGLAGVQVLGTW